MPPFDLIGIRWTVDVGDVNGDRVGDFGIGAFNSWPEPMCHHRPTGKIISVSLC